MILLILPFIIACKKNEFDLDKISFPIDIAALKEEYKIEKDIAFVNTNYHTTEQDLLIFNGYNFSGSLANTALPLNNKLFFYEEDATKRVDAYEINIKTTNKAEKFEDLLTNKLGKPDFYYRNEEFSFRIWELGGKIYFFETNNTGKYNGNKFKSCSLRVVNSQNKFLIDFFSGGGFQYYGNYLYEKNKPENKDRKFTYGDFIHKKEKEDGLDSYFLKNYVK